MLLGITSSSASHQILGEVSYSPIIDTYRALFSN